MITVAIFGIKVNDTKEIKFVGRFINRFKT